MNLTIWLDDLADSLNLLLPRLHLVAPLAQFWEEVSSPIASWHQRAIQASVLAAGEFHASSLWPSLRPLQTTYKRQDSHPGMQSTSNIFFGWLQAWDWDKVRMFHQKSKPLTFQSEKDINVNFVTKHLLLLWDPGACVMLLCRHIWIKNQEVMQSNRVLS